MTSFHFYVSLYFRRTLKVTVYWLLFISAPLIIDLLFRNDVIKPNYPLFVGAIFLAYTIGYVVMDVIFRIDFEHSLQQIIIHYKTPFGKPKQKSLCSTDARLDVYSRKRKGRRAIHTIDFMKGKMEVSSVSAEQGGFTKTDLYQLLKTAEDLQIETRVV